MSYEQIVSPVFEFFGLTPENALEGRRGPRATEATLTDKLFGVTSDELKQEQKFQQDFENKQTYKPQVEALGGTFKPGQTEGVYLNQIDELKTNRANTNYTNSPAGQAAAFAQQQQTDQLALTNKRLDNQMEMALLDRADAKDQRAAELAYQKLRDRKEDMRYNERMEQLDRKDRRQAMQSLAAGLASLGAAFAL